MRWFRAYSEMVDDDKLRLLAYEDRWHFVALLCCKAQGILEQPGPLMRRKVAVKLGLDLRELDEVARRLGEVGLISTRTLQPLAWDRRQFVSDHDMSRNERQQRFREKKKQESNALRNGGITAPDTDTDTDTENLDSASGISNEIPTAVVTSAEPKVTRPAVPVQAIVDLYHELLPNNPRVQKVTEPRASAIKARWRSELPNLEKWREYLTFCRDSKFLTGRVDPQPGRSRFVADIAFLCREKTVVEVAEGKYHRK